MSEFAAQVNASTEGVIDLSRRARALWAKTDPEDSSVWLPLYIHLSDTAHTMVRLWDEWVPQNVKNLFARYCCGNEQLARKALVFLAGAHDIGKPRPSSKLSPVVAGGTGSG